MKCAICKSSDIEKKTVEEEIKSGRDIVLIPMEVLVCVNCGESYYDSRAMRKIEELKDRLSKHDLEVEEIGKVFRTRAA